MPTVPLKLEDMVVVIETSEGLDERDEYGIERSLQMLTRIPVERGMDAQEFRCPSCRKSIGGSFGAWRLCNLDGRSYCEDCWKRGDECLIPARMILNWDYRPRPIAKPSRAFLRSVADRPLFRIDALNPQLYAHSPAMNKLRRLRTKLSLVVMYLLSCKQSTAEDIKRRLWPHDYLYTDIHLYSFTVRFNTHLTSISTFRILRT